MLAGFTVLLVCQLAGEVLVQATGLPVPGPVIGLLILLALLTAGRGRPEPEPVQRAADGLLNNLSLLFVPAGVGVMQQLSTLRDEWVPAVAALLASTLAALVVSGLLIKTLRRR